MSLANPWVLIGASLWLNMQLLSSNAIVIHKNEAFNFAWHCTKRITEAWIPLPLGANGSLCHGQMYSLAAHRSHKFNTWLNSKALEGAVYSVSSWNCILQVTCVYLILAIFSQILPHGASYTSGDTVLLSNRWRSICRGCEEDPAVLYSCKKLGLWMTLCTSSFSSQLRHGLSSKRRHVMWPVYR